MIRTPIAALLVSTVMGNIALAGDFDGEKPLMCSSIQAIECAIGDCYLGLAEDINAPQFFRIDFNAGTIKTIAQGEHKRTSKIEHRDTFQGKIVLQGAEDGDDMDNPGVAWSLAIDTESGNMVLTASGDEVGFIMFGACTTL